MVRDYSYFGFFSLCCYPALLLLFCLSLFVSTAPPGLNPLEHEELPMSVQQVQNVRPQQAAVPQTSTERHHGAFSQVTLLPKACSIKPNDTVSLFRASMDNKSVILRALKGEPSPSRHGVTEQQQSERITISQPVCVLTFFLRVG